MAIVSHLDTIIITLAIAQHCIFSLQNKHVSNNLLTLNVQFQVIFHVNNEKEKNILKP